MIKEKKIISKNYVLKDINELFTENQFLKERLKDLIFNLKENKTNRINLEYINENIFKINDIEDLIQTFKNNIHAENYSDSLVYIHQIRALIDNIQNNFDEIYMSLFSDENLRHLLKTCNKTIINCIEIVISLIKQCESKILNSSDKKLFSEL